MAIKTLVGGADFPDDIPKENVKEIVFREDGSIEKITYYDPINRNTGCGCWHARPYYEPMISGPYHTTTWSTGSLPSTGTYQ